MSALLMSMLFVIIFIIKTGGHYESCRQTGQSKRRILVTAVPVAILLNTPSFSCIMNLAMVWSRLRSTHRFRSTTVFTLSW